MATLFKEKIYNLATLINRIDMSLIGLPDLQRPFNWSDAKVRELFDSLFKVIVKGQWITSPNLCSDIDLNSYLL